MNYLEVMSKRHSVRSYTKEPIAQEIQKELTLYAEELEKKSGLSFQLFFDEPKCFDSLMGHYGKFHDVSNYLVILGEKGKDIDVGYFGEDFVIKAQSLGINSCWVALTYGKTPVKKKKGERIYIVISLGYGVSNGSSHKNKDISKLVDDLDNKPEWFQAGFQAALLAPTAMNQQQFHLSYENKTAYLKIKAGPCNKIDAGIVKYHFEMVSKEKLIIQ